MKIGCLQFAPKVGDVNNNLNRADAVLNRCESDDLDDLDLLVLPELAFTGYNFKSLKDISPFLEPSQSGVSALWARTIALKYDCTVVVGYPEVVDPSQKWPTGPEYYNAAIVVNGDGETIANYRKTHLYRTDETWALEGLSGFYKGHWDDLGDTAIGICMDLNPYRFEAPWHAFEFAFHVLEMRADLVIVSMAWMTREDARMFSRMPQEPDMETLMYWVTRLEPVIRAEHEDEIIFVFANRTGVEDDAVYAGTSAVLGIKDGEVRVYGVLGRGEKKMLLVDTDVPPYARLTYSSEGRPAQMQPSTTAQGRFAGENSTTHHGNQNDAPGHNSPVHQMDQSDQYRGSSEQSNSSHSTKSSLGGSRREGSSRSAGKRLTVKTDWQTLNNAGNGESSTIPTPTMPSPTPLALRPRIAYPSEDSMMMAYLGLQSPAIKSFKLELAQAAGYTDPSFKSLTSTSVERWKSRPSEPQTNSGRSSQQEVSPLVSSDKERLAALSESSPSSSELYWIPANHLLQTPVEGRARISSGESHLYISSDQSTVIRHDRVGSMSSNYEAEMDPKPEIESRTADDTAPPPQENERMPNRPGSPKSRNASRSRGPDRTDSPFADVSDMHVIARKLGEIAQRVGSVQGRHIPRQGCETPVHGYRGESASGIGDRDAIHHGQVVASRLIPNQPPDNDVDNWTTERPISDPIDDSARGRDDQRRAHQALQYAPNGGRTVSRGRQPPQKPLPPGDRRMGSRDASFGAGSRPPPEQIDLSQFVMIQEFHPRESPMRGHRSQSVSHHTPAEELKPIGANVPLPPSPAVARPVVSAPPPHRIRENATTEQVSTSKGAIVKTVAQPCATTPEHSPSRTSFEPSTPKAMDLEHSPPTALIF